MKQLNTVITSVSPMHPGMAPMYSLSSRLTLFLTATLTLCTSSVYLVALQIRYFVSFCLYQISLCGPILYSFFIKPIATNRHQFLFSNANENTTRMCAPLSQKKKKALHFFQFCIFSCKHSTDCLTVSRSIKTGF